MKSRFEGHRHQSLKGTLVSELWLRESPFLLSSFPHQLQFCSSSRYCASSGVWNLAIK